MANTAFLSLAFDETSVCEQFAKIAPILSFQGSRSEERPH